MDLENLGRLLTTKNRYAISIETRVTPTTLLEIVGDFIDQGKQNLRMLQESLTRYKDMYQYVYSHMFREVYTSEKRGFDVKSNFHILFKPYRDRHMMRQYSLTKKKKRITRTNNQKKRTNTNKNRLKTSINFATAKRLKNTLKNDRLTDAKKQKN